jgi:hypothetical protein
MVIVVMNTEKIAVFAMATMVPWHPTSPVEDDPHIQEQATHARGSLLGFTQSVGFFSGIIYGKIIYGKYFFQTIRKMD